MASGNEPSAGWSSNICLGASDGPLGDKSRLPIVVVVVVSTPLDSSGLRNKIIGINTPAAVILTRIFVDS